MGLGPRRHAVAQHLCERPDMVWQSCTFNHNVAREAKIWLKTAVTLPIGLQNWNHRFAVNLSHKAQICDSIDLFRRDLDPSALRWEVWFCKTISVVTSYKYRIMNAILKLNILKASVPRVHLQRYASNFANLWVK